MKDRNYYIMDIEKPIYERYDRAVENNDAQELAWFMQFGNDERESQMIANVRWYEQYLKCGYTEKPHFDEYGWLDNDRQEKFKDNSETIILVKEKQVSAHIILMQHPNGMWVAGKRYSLPTSGEYSFPGIWNKQYATKQEAMNMAIDSIIKSFTNSDRKNISKYISILKAAKMETRQLSLFDFVA